MRRYPLGVVSLFVLCVVVPAQARHTPVQDCIVKKEFAAGGKIAAKMTCYAMQTFTGKVDPRCLPKAETKFAISMAKAGSLCPGDAATVEGVVDSCVSTLAGDGQGAKHCSVPTQIALGKAARNILKCAAAEFQRPGTFDACSANQDRVLTRVLATAGGCASGNSVADVHNGCDTPIIGSVTPSTTTTSTTVP